MKSEIDELVYEWVDIEEVNAAPADSKSSCDEDVVDQDYSRCHIFFHPSPDPRVFLRPKGKGASQVALTGPNVQPSDGPLHCLSFFLQPAEKLIIFEFEFSLPEENL